MGLRLFSFQHTKRKCPSSQFDRYKTRQSGKKKTRAKRIDPGMEKMASPKANKCKQWLYSSDISGCTKWQRNQTRVNLRRELAIPSTWEAECVSRNYIGFQYTLYRILRIEKEKNRGHTQTGEMSSTDSHTSFISSDTWGRKRKRWAFRPNGNPLWRSEYFATINFAQDRIRILILDSAENQIFIRFWPSSLFFSCNELDQSASGISHRNERGKQKPAGNREN